MVKNPLQADRSTASTRLTIAEMGSFPNPVARASGMGFTAVEVYVYCADFASVCSQLRHTRGRRLRNCTLPLTRQA